MLGLFGIDHDRWAQLDLVYEWPFRGSRLFLADDLVPLMIMDPLGFRRIREGAEGLFLFVNKGFRRSGRPDRESLTKYRILEKMSEDRVGTEAGAAVLGPAGKLLLDAADSALKGEWNATALLGFQARMALRGVTDPSLFLSRMITRGWRIPRCPVNRAVMAGRQLQRVEEWLRTVEKNHVVQVIAQPRAGE